MIGVLGPEADTRPVRRPKSPSFWLFGRHFQSLAPPDPLHPPSLTDQPAWRSRAGNLAIAVAAILPGQLDHVGRQPFGVLSAPRDLALRRAMLAERRTGAALGDVQMLADMLDAGAPTRGA